MACLGIMPTIVGFVCSGRIYGISFLYNLGCPHLSGSYLALIIKFFAISQIL